MIARTIHLFAFTWFLSAVASGQTPHWIWLGEKESNEKIPREVVFDREFEVESPVSSIQLTMATMYCRAQLMLDDRVIAELDPFDPLTDQALQMSLAAGSHRLSVRAASIDGPSAFFVQLKLKTVQGKTHSVVTDRSWQQGGISVVERSVVERSPVQESLLVPDGRRVQIGAVENYEQWKQALGDAGDVDPASFQLTPGFEIRLVRTAKPAEDSWVSMAFDPDGRLIIAKEKSGLLRMELSPDGQSVTKVESFAESLQECRGLAFIQRDLYANANNSKKLVRVPMSTSGFGEPELVFASTGGVGHGRNDLALGPDGKLYSIHGDAVDLPNGNGVTDFTSPFREASEEEQTREGHLLRIDPDSKVVELLAAGLRNPFGIDFNEDGEVFSYDADAEFDMGAPWYRPTRVSHLVSGADYGWRGVTGSWPPYYPDHADNALHNLDIGKGSPTAVKFGTRSQFPDPFQDALFILDWAYGRIVAVHMVPRGASYLMQAETFLQGRPLNVTDLDFAPDGSMYLVTGGRQTQSALYRVRWVGTNDALAKERVAAAKSNWLSRCDTKAGQSRRRRRLLESQLITPPGPEPLEMAWDALGDSDPWISYAGRNLLERQPIDSWASRALAEPASRTAAQALLALSRSGDVRWTSQVVQRLNQIVPTINDQRDRLALLQAYRLCFQHLDRWKPGLRQETSRALNDIYPCHSDVGPIQSHNWILSELLVELQHPEVVSKSVQLLLNADNQRDQMQYLNVLRRAKIGWTTEDRHDYFSSLQQAEQYLVGAGMAGFLQKIRDEALSNCDANEREKMVQVLDQSLDVMSRERPASTTRPMVREWSLSDFPKADVAPIEGNVKRGAEVFVAAQCASCHRYGARGALVGPDLTSAARRFSRRDLLSSILDPSKVIAQNYQAIQVVTVDGRSYTGLAPMIGDYRSPLLRLATDPASPMEIIEIAKQDIESQKPSTVSWMPLGLLNHFSRQEIEDLLAYLRSSP